MEPAVPNGDKSEVSTGPGTVSEVEPSTYGVSFASSRTLGAPPESSGATATPVKPYTPVSAAESSAVKMSSVNRTVVVTHLRYMHTDARMYVCTHTHTHTRYLRAIDVVY